MNINPIPQQPQFTAPVVNTQVNDPYSGVAPAFQGTPMGQAPSINLSVPPPQVQSPGNYQTMGVVTQETTHPAGMANQTAEMVPVPPVEAGQCAKVGMGMGFTKNLGDYQSMKASVYVELPWAVTDIQTGLDHAEKIARDRILKLWSEG